MQIWRDDVNKAGGLLGRPVELVYYDDQTNPATVPGIYTKLPDVDKVDLVVSGYGTNLIAPAMPIMIERKLLFMGLFGLGNNLKHKYWRYFQIAPNGPDPAGLFSEGFFELASKQNPKPKTVASWAPTRNSRRTRWSARASTRQAARLPGPLRQDVSAEHGGLHADRTRDQVAEPGHRLRRVLPARLGGMIQAAQEVGLEPKLFGGGWWACTSPRCSPSWGRS